MKLKPRRTEIPLNHPWEAEPARIVSDAAIATGNVGDGRLIPLVIIDSSKRPDIEELVRVHEHLPPGDIKVQWGSMQNAPDSVGLILRFIRPVEALLVLNFEIVRQGVIVDQILSSKALYLQPGREGDRLKNTFDAKKILIEVPETGFSETWKKTYFKHLVKDFRGKGLSKSQAKEATKEVMEQWRRIGSSRLLASRT